MSTKCGHHPDRDASGGTCARCGTYVCEECWIEGAVPPLCVPCLKHLERAPDVKQVKILGILLMVHGGLVAALGLYYVLFGGFMFDAMREIPATSGDPLEDQLPEILIATMSFIGIFHIIPAALQAFAGWQVFRFRGLGVGIVGGLVGLFSVCGIYCAPSALLLAVYAVYVLTRTDVRARFAVVVPPASKGT